MDDGQAEQWKPIKQKLQAKTVNAVSTVAWHIWEGLCVRHFLLTATSLFSGRQCLWHQFNPNTTKQKFKKL